ncbi:MAG: TIGR00730 family Rossman fold protein [Muribaculaceae bacterium]|nr:TIGR00730 family Rossman fold protein [Muribaculaceae bacterium]
MKDTITIAVYCSAVADLPEHWQEGARATGEWIGRHKGTLVYGGVDAGLMTVVARTAHLNGARVVGVVPARRREWSSQYNDIVVPTSDLNERKGTMQLLANAFVVLPGGYGTLDEFSTSFGYINFTDQPDKHIVLFNPDNLYDPLIEQLHRMVETRLLRPSALDILHVVRTPEEIVSTLDKLFEK